MIIDLSERRFMLVPFFSAARVRKTEQSSIYFFDEIMRVCAHTQ